MAKVANAMQKIALQKLYVAQALGIGEREDTFYNIGVYTSRALALVALEELAQELDMDIERNVEEFTLNA